MLDANDLDQLVFAKTSAVTYLKGVRTNQLLVLSKWLDKLVINREDLRERARTLFLLVYAELNNRVNQYSVSENTRIIDQNKFVD